MSLERWGRWPVGLLVFLGGVWLAPAQTLTSVTVSPTTVVGGVANSTGTVTLSAVAPAGGALVALSSNNAAATVPANVTVAAVTSG